ncbi:MAG: TRZ/ATZ family hydrolase [Sulfuritalea sp.]|nr:TRZ/ATZ family hydrolase [Sulfuritalea sp.]
MNRPLASESDAEDIDLLIRPEWIIPIEPERVVLNGHSLAIDKGNILALLPDELALKQFRPRRTLDLPGQVLLPGLINLHTHAAMSLLRGYADDLPLMRWLSERIWPAEAKFAGPEFVRAGTILACAEMLRGGITTFNDMYFFPDAAAAAARHVGMRASLGIVVIEFPTAYAADAGDYLTKGLAARDALGADPLVSFCLAPHAPYTVADKTFDQIATLSAQLEIPIHVHLHETRHEIEESLKQHGVRPIERLHRLGLLSPQLIAVHAVHLDDREIDLLAHEGCHLAHCPTSNLKLGSGIPRMAAIQAHGVNFGLGTDGAASNNRLDLFHEMRHAALLGKGQSENAEVLDAHAILQAATLGGARALGLEERIGSLRPGKAADLCAVRLDEWLTQPCFDPASHLVYVAGREQVSHTWIAGNLVMCDGVPLKINVSELLDITGLWHNRLKS